EASISSPPPARAPAGGRGEPPSRERSPQLTVVMPCLNEARTVAACVAKARGFFERSGIAGEVVVADNGSTDGSQALAIAAGARVVAIEQRGYGAALMGGIAAARGRWVVMGDADDSYDFASLDAIVERLAGGAQLVMGNRFTGGIDPNAMPPLHRYLGNPVLSFIGRLLFRTPIGDFHCGLRAFDREAVIGLGLRCTGMEFASEMVMRATLAKLRISEVPTRLAKDGRDRPPHLRSWRDGWRHLRLLLMFSPRWLLLYPGLALMVIGLVPSIGLLFGPLEFGGFGLDIHTLLYCATASILGLQLCVLAVLTKAAGVSVGELPSGEAYERFTRMFTLERGIAVGVVLIAFGVGSGVLSALDWTQTGLSALDPSRTMRSVIPACALVLAGSECVFASFVLSFLAQPAARRTRLVPSHRPEPSAGA
ncbi:MAG: glycosyltransferase family 2 protein, partial [Burkholderiaceae bacterium]